MAASVQPPLAPTQPLADDPRNIWCVGYGLDTFDKLFTPRQLIALTTFSDLVCEAREKVRRHTATSGDRDSVAYAAAIVTYLGLGVSKLADAQTTLTRWKPSMDQAIATFARQALPMTWDYAESNAFNNAAGDYQTTVGTIAKVILGLPSSVEGYSQQQNATADIECNLVLIVSTDPPYYDNISYADLSDFFYVWLRRTLGKVHPELFSTMLAPKDDELVASPYRFGGDKRKAKAFFEEGLSRAFANMRRAHHPDYPLAVYYAFKQVESDEDSDLLTHDLGESAEERTSGTLASTGWETMLEGLIRSGFATNGTWPMRTELSNRMISSGTNALASSIVLVCRPRPADAKAATRREFLNALKAELPAALRRLQQGNIAPVDLAQAAIGPGMAVFSRYSKVIEADGTPMRVRTALQIINQELDAVLAEQEGEFDADTRWAIAWFDQHGTNEGPYGTAETLSKAKNTSVGGMVDAGIAVARGGKVRLLRRDELPADWNPASDGRLTIWEIAQHLVHALDKRGEGGAAELLAKVGGEGEIARDLAYRLYTTCERKGWAQEALAYNALVVAWPEITRQAAERRRAAPVQQGFDL